ncbi:MAG: ribose 5-phosphate isomerase B [Chloroflexi bacterium]|nr:ribose 5-phosphate isomerase B [Chloroflexota bacterium]
MRIALGADHAGYELKETLERVLIEAGHVVHDFGAHSAEPSDYPDYAEAVARAVAQGEFERGVLVCGNGVGMCVAANKLAHIRAVLAMDSYTARSSRQDDDTNILCLGQRVIGPEVAVDIVKFWLETPFSGAERHRRRLEKLAALEAQEMRRKAGRGIP